MNQEDEAALASLCRKLLTRDDGIYLKADGTSVCVDGWIYGATEAEIAVLRRVAGLTDDG
jgi:hypothetical protein